MKEEESQLRDLASKDEVRITQGQSAIEKLGREIKFTRDEIVRVRKMLFEAEKDKEDAQSKAKEFAVELAHAEEREAKARKTADTLKVAFDEKDKMAKAQVGTLSDHEERQMKQNIESYANDCHLLQEKIRVEETTKKNLHNRLEKIGEDLSNSEARNAAVRLLLEKEQSRGGAGSVTKVR